MILDNVSSGLLCLKSLSGVGKLWITGQIQPVTSFCKVLLNVVNIYVLFMAAVFATQAVEYL